MAYTDDGYEADDDLYEAGVSVDDPTFSETIDDDDAGSWISSNKWMVAVFVVALILMSVAMYVGVKKCRNTDTLHDHSKSK